MDRLGTLANDDNPDLEPIVNGVIAEDAVHPDDQISVTIPSYDNGKTFGPSHFAPRPLQDGTILLPSRGDECLVGIDDDGEAHILTWWAADPT